MAVPTPTPDEVHALIPQRPAFTLSSRPSTNEVQAIINIVADAVAVESISGTFPTRFTGKIKYVIALNVAAQVEMSYFPEQQLGPDSPAAQLTSSYTRELLGLRSLLTALDLSGAEGTGRAYSIPFATSPVIYDYPPSYWTGL